MFLFKLFYTILHSIFFFLKKIYVFFFVDVEYLEMFVSEFNIAHLYILQFYNVFNCFSLIHFFTFHLISFLKKNGL